MKASFGRTVIIVATVLGVIVVALTELLSLIHALTRGAAFLFWVPLAIIALRYASTSFEFRSIRENLKALDRVDWLLVSVIVAIALVNLFLAITAPPSSWDALSYHAPRISHWIQNKSVAHYPTHIDRQLWIPPGFEFFALQLQLLVGSDRFINCVQWLSSLGCIVVSSRIAAQLGARRKGQLFAALFTATLPMAIAQASGSQADLFASFWIVSSISLILEMTDAPIGLRDSLLLGACVGLAALSKGTAYILLLPFIIWLVIEQARRVRFRIIAPATIATIAAFAMNAGHYARNYAAFGNALTNPRTERLTNEAVTPAVVLSNIARNTTLHTQTRSASLNDAQHRIVGDLHAALGIDASDSRSTYFGARYSVASRTRTEAWVGNPFHLLLIIVGAALTGYRKRKNQRPQMLLVVCLVAAFILFCAILKWQPWNSRLHLPLFIASAGLVGAVLEKKLPARQIAMLALLLTIPSMLVLLRNSARPLLVREPIWTIPRERRYFKEIGWMYAPYVAVGNFLAARRCANVGLITSWVDWEEPLWVVMRNRSTMPVTIRHVALPGQRRIPSDLCAIVTVFAYDRLRPPDLGVSPDWKLALARDRIGVYVPTL